MIQLALDFVDKELALKVARMCLPHVDILEAGTPLIKAHGMKIVRELKKFEVPVYADLKTFDTGSYEAKLAAENDADFVSVLAAANDRTVREFCKTCMEYSVKSVADLIQSPISRCKFLEEAGVSYIAVHSGIDQQREGMTPFETLKQVRGMVKTPLIVAGGITKEHVARVIPYAEIVVIGSAITGALDPAGASRAISKVYRLARGQMI